MTVSEKHYAGVSHGLPKAAKTLEAAMEVTKELAEVEARISGKGRQVKAAKAATAG